MNATTVEGRVGGEGGAVAFTVNVSATGTVSLDQARALVHPDATNPDDAVTLTSADLITLTRTDTITDRDGDSTSDSSSISIGQALSFEDDGPSASLTLDATSTVLVSEQGGSAKVTFDLTGTNVPGADGLKTQAYSLDLVTQNGVESGLKTTAQQTIYLYQINDTTIVGTTVLAASFDINNPTGVVFTLVVDTDSGSITMAGQGLYHPLTQDILYLLPEINAVYSVTDGDGDVATDTVNLNNVIGFVDGVPSFTLVNDGGDAGTVVNISAPNAATTYTTQLADWQYGVDGAAGADNIRHYRQSVARLEHQRHGRGRSQGCRKQRGRQADAERRRHDPCRYSLGLRPCRKTPC